MKKILKYIIPVAGILLSVGISSCVGDLDLPDGSIDPGTTTDATPEQMFNKCYAVIGVAGNYGANGGSDVDGIDGGTSGYIRQMWNAQELTTDEAICCWGDDGIPQFNFCTFDASHPMLQGFYYRLYTAIVFYNHYLENYGDYNQEMSAEVRFLRALAYYYLMDGWGNVPFVTTAESEDPEQASRVEVFNFIEEELLAIHDQMHQPIALRKGSEDNGWRWGRVDQDACNLLLARLYLNAKVYTGKERYAEAARYAKMVMDGPHKLHTTDKIVTIGDDVTSTDYTFSAYRMLFMGDNDVTDASTEAVFPILQDGIRTTSWGTSLFMMASTFDKNMHESILGGSATNGTDQNWGGNRARPDLIRLFFPADNAPSGNSWKVAPAARDDRALFNTLGRSLEVDDWNTFTNGFAVAKFNNFKTTLNSSGKNFEIGQNNTFPDGDFFLMRSAEAYLTYAEALTRQTGEADNTRLPAQAMGAVKAIRDRAHAQNLTSMTLRQLLDEWGREFYFEGRRRTDLIRFGKFGGDTGYNWQWKGGVKEGQDFREFRNLFAIPTNDLIVNKKLKQNDGYPQ